MTYALAGQFGPEAIITLSGAPQPSVEVHVYQTDGVTPATLYTTRTKTLTAGNPAVTDNAGNLLFYADPGRYVLAATVAGTTRTFTVSVSPDPADVENVGDFQAALDTKLGITDAATGYIAQDHTHDETDSAVLALFAGSVARVATKDGLNSLVGMTHNDQPAASAVFPCGIVGYGRTANAGNQVFGVFGRADLYGAGVATNELNSFNYASAPAGTFPPDRSIGTTDRLAIALSVAAGGTYSSAIGIHLGREGSAPNSFLAGVYASPDACLTYGAFYDATSGSGPATGIRVNVKNASLGLDVQAQGINSVPVNLRAAASQSAELLRVQNSGGTAVAAIGNQGQFRPGNGSTVGGAIWGGSGAPTHSGTSGDVYWRTDTPTTANQRFYICTGGTSWTGIL